MLIRHLGSRIRQSPAENSFSRMEAPSFVARSESVRYTFRKAILSAFLLLCSHGRKNDIAMLRKFLRKVLGISLRIRNILRKVLGINLPTRGSRVLCTCTADIVLQCSPFSDVHARGTFFFGTASCMSCFGYFVSWLISLWLC